MIKYTADETQNCLQCCIAGMFDKELEDVETVHAWGKRYPNWFDGLYNYSMINLGHAPVSVVDDTLDDLFHIAIVRPKEGLPHCVIAKGMAVVWDPSPGDKLESLAEVDWEYSILFVQVLGLCIQKSCQTSYSNWKLEEANAERITRESGE